MFCLALIDDMIIENDQCYKQAEIYSTVFAGLMGARGNLVSNSTNTLLRKLTLINVVFLPLNLIAGISGMSEFSMVTAPLHWWVAYPALLLTMLGLGAVIVLVLRKNAPVQPEPLLFPVSLGNLQTMQAVIRGTLGRLPTVKQRGVEVIDLDTQRAADT